MRRTVHFQQTVSVSVTVDAAEDASVEGVIETALEQGIEPLCFQCSGYGEEFTRDDDGELIPIEITDDSGAQLWREDHKGASA